MDERKTLRTDLVFGSLAKLKLVSSMSSRYAFGLDAVQLIVAGRVGEKVVEITLVGCCDGGLLGVTGMFSLLIAGSFSHPVNGLPVLALL